MSYKKIIALTIFSVASSYSLAFPACGLNIPDGIGLQQESSDECSILIEKKINFESLDYFHIYEHTGVAELLSDNTYFINNKEAPYFVSEEINDPKFTIHTIKQDQAQPIQFGKFHGYEGFAKYFIQILPTESQQDTSYPSSISCAFIVAGSDEKSFKMRTCFPSTASGMLELGNIVSAIKTIQPLK